MADIDQIIAGGAGASTRADFSKLAGLLDYFYKGQDQAYQQEGRNLFKGGVPQSADGSVDYGAMRNALFQHGDVPQGVAVDNLGIQRDQLKLGQEASQYMGKVEGGGPPASPIVSPPSSNRNAYTTVAPALGKGGAAAGQRAPQGDQPGSIVGLVSAAGVPDELAGPIIQQVSAMTRTDPNATLSPDMTPRVQQVVQAAAQRMKGGQAPAQGQPAPQAPPQQAQPVQPPPQAPVMAQSVNPQQNQGTFGAPAATPTRGAVPTGNDPEIQKQIATYTYIASNPAYPKAVQEAAKSRLEALQRNAEPTGQMKEYDLARRQGYQGTMQDFLAENEAKKTGATEEAKLSSTKYQSLVDAGTKAQQEIPQLSMLQEQMNDPNFFSGAGEKYNLMYKRLKSAAGIDPDAAVPQEFLRKATAASVLSSFGALKGLGPIRVAEMNLAKEAAAAPSNSIPANKLLVEIQKRTYERQGDIAEMAQNYKEKNGALDVGFDKQVTSYFKAHPIFSEGEVKDFHKAIGEAPKVTAQSANPPMANAKKAPDGNWYVPDPGRQGKYLKVVQ